MAVEQARQHVATLLGVEPARIVFTSGSTEALNAALRGIASTATARRALVSPVEHKAVLDTVEALGLISVPLPLTQGGAVDVGTLMIADDVAMVVAMAANNETGALSSLAALADLAHEMNAPLVCDITQAAGKVPLALSDDRVDFAAISAHKFHGPQGVGALVVPSSRPLVHWKSHQTGGGHERGWRSGTLNVAGIVGMGEAARIAHADLYAEGVRQTNLRDRLEHALAERLGAIPTVTAGPRLPNITAVRIVGIDADALIANTPDVAFASGSACTSAVPAPSHVLTTLGCTTQEAEETIRLSVGATTTVADIDKAVEHLAAGVARLRKLGL